MIFIEPERTFFDRQKNTSSTFSSLRGVPHPLAPKVIQKLREHGSEPVPLWRTINELAKLEKREDWQHERFHRLRYWVAIRELQRAKVIWRHYNHIALADFAYKPRHKPTTNRALGVTCALPEKSRSKQVLAQKTEIVDVLKNVPLAGKISALVARDAASLNPETQNAAPTDQQISDAAKLIASRSRPRRRKPTGLYKGERTRRYSEFRVPSGEVLQAFAIRRGVVYLFAPEGSGRFIDLYKVSDVERVKNPAAVLLGQLKLGKKERQSAAKAAAAKKNGIRPVRPGRRPRGRARRQCYLL